ncbi:MAG: tripartite tricarboxylate transporter TctB family protein [Sphaerochaetaceae bacterium]|nr:tripartite tricarboxylate transporter TctB family protein [Sphaerochaetaceae bacterium]
MTNYSKKDASDLIMGVFLDIFGIYLTYAGLHMKVFKTFLDGPGFFPFVLGLILLTLGIIMTTVGIRSGGFLYLKENVKGHKMLAFFTHEETVRVLILIAMMAVYIFGLIGRMHFSVATCIYLLATMFYLRSTKWWKIIIISVVASIMISFIFQYFFKIPLP